MLKNMTVQIFNSVWDFSWRWSCCTQRIAVVIKGAHVLLFIRPLRQWRLWRPMSFHIQHQLRRRKWGRRAQAVRLGLMQAQGWRYHEARGGTGLVFQGHRQTAWVWSCIAVAAQKKQRGNLCSYLSLRQAHSQVTVKVMKINLVQLAGTRFFWMRIFAWPLLRERCEGGFLNRETLEVDLKPNMHLFQWHSAWWVKCVHMVGKLLKHPVALSHLTPACASIYRSTFNFTGRKRHHNAGCIKLHPFNYLIIFSPFISLIFFPSLPCSSVFVMAGCECINITGATCGLWTNYTHSSNREDRLHQPVLHLHHCRSSNR